MDDIIFELILIIISIILTGISGYLKFGRIPELNTLVNDGLTRLSESKNILNEVLSFIDPEKPMADTSLNVIKNIIPSSAYKMNYDSLNRVLSTCESDEEKILVNNLITEYENPVTEGDECCEYILETAGATYKVQWGVPETISDKFADSPKLSQKQISEIVTFFADDLSPFEVLWTILENERKHNFSYEIIGKDAKVLVVNGTYSGTALRT